MFLNLNSSNVSINIHEYSYHKSGKLEPHLETNKNSQNISFNYQVQKYKCRRVYVVAEDTYIYRYLFCCV